MKPLMGRIQDGDVLICDGAMGTHLMAAGVEPGSCLEALNTERPELPEQVSSMYVEAGADVVMTNTLGASPTALARHGLDGQAAEINRGAVRAARNAAAGRAYVAASCGPSGKILKPYGDADPGEVAESFELQAAALAAEGVDLIVVETMTDLEEACIAVRAARKGAPGTPVAATMTFDPTPRGFFTIMGNSIEQAARDLREAGAEIVGSNCGNGLKKMILIAREFHARTDLPLLIQSNAGLPESRDGILVFPETPAFFEEKTGELLDAGVSIIGGCCGTTPDHIRAIRRAVDAGR